MPRTTVPRCHAHRGGGVAWVNRAMRRSRFPLSASIRLWLAVLKRPSRCRTREKGGGRERPPPKQGGHAVPHRWHLWHASVPAPMGSLPSSFIPAGRLVKTPLSPRASSWRIGPRRQGFASPLRALDGSGPIRKTRCLRGERGGSGRGVRGRASPLRMIKDIIIHVWGGGGRAARNLSAIPAI